jgi:hypothetical protein
MAPIPINQTVAVGTTLAVIGTPIVLNGVGRDVSLSIQNLGAAALTGFKIQRQFIDGGAWVDWLAGTDFNFATAKCSASGGPSGYAIYSLPAACIAWLDFDPGGVVAVQFLASAASATTLALAGGARLDTHE